MTYTPDITHYQQIPLGGPTGPFDCTAWGTAILVDAHTGGATKTTGRAIRLHSSEPIPDRSSPGLNLPQTDTAVLEITNGRVNLDTRVQGMALTRAEAQSRILAGRWANVQVWRQILIDRGYGGGNHFGGGHDITVHARPIDMVPVIFDPLVPHGIPASWDAIWDAAEYYVEGFAPGKVYTQYTRDLTPNFEVVIVPPAGKRAQTFIQFILDANGRIYRRKQHTTGGLRRPCTPKTWHPSVIKGVPGRYLVMITEGRFKNMWVDARYSHEV
jgi:hypothetical protein